MRSLRNILSLLILFPAIHCQAQPKPNLIISSDIGGDTDDQQSLVRLLMYSNELNLLGLCTSSLMQHGHEVHPELINEQINAYAEVYPNLLKHDPDYPSPQYLKSLVKSGLELDDKLGNGFNTESSNWIIKQVNNASEPVWISIWGGSREVAQALWEARETMDEEALKEFVGKIRIHMIGDQDGHKRWILANFPDVFMISNGFINYKNYKVRALSCYRGQYMTGDTSKVGREWVNENIINDHGPLGKLYPGDGHGTKGMKEGDTPSFSHLLGNGLDSKEDPSFGGWGGRFRKIDGNLYVDAADFHDGTWNERHSVSRWRNHFQNDFAARMDWCQNEFEAANHHPVVNINGNNSNKTLQFEVNAGGDLMLDASQSHDPDHDQLIFDWWVYQEPSGILENSIEIEVNEDHQAMVFIPKKYKGKQLHLILEVTDKGLPALTSFRRILINVK